jgi:hypothetical protein
MHSLLFLLVLLSVLLGCKAGAFEPIQVMCEINGFLIPAIVDTGAEVTVMSAACAKRCHISDAIDTQYSGKAIGVGTSEIIGGIDDLSFRIGPVNFQNKVSILSNSRCDFLIGLDILTRFKCDINVGEKILKLSVRGNKIRIPFVSQRGTGYNKEKEAKSKSKKDGSSNERVEKLVQEQQGMQGMQEMPQRSEPYEHKENAYPLGSSPVLATARGGYRPEEAHIFTLEELLGEEAEEDLGEEVSMEGV